MSIEIPEINYYQADENTKVIFLHGGKNVFQVKVITRVGSNNESKDEYGLAHFYEHMVFKGKYKGKRISDVIEYLGCGSNASTSHFITDYYINGSSEHSEIMVEIILQMLYEPQFPECDIKKELQVVLEELHMGKDDIGRIIYTAIASKLYKDIDETLYRPVIGYEENILTFDRNKLLNFYKEKFMKNEKIIILTGNFDKEKMKKLISSKTQPLTSWTPIFEPLERELKVNYYKQKIHGITWINIPQDYCSVIIGFRAIDNKSCWDLVSRMTSQILAGGMSSRLFRVLREENGITYYQGSNSDMHDSHGMFYVNFGARADNLQKALTLVLEQLLSFKNVNDYELQVIKNSYETTLLFGAESLMTTGSTVINYIIAKEDPEHYTKIRDKINKIKPKHINNFASKIFQRDNMSIFISCRKEISDDLNIEI